MKYFGQIFDNATFPIDLPMVQSILRNLVSKDAKEKSHEKLRDAGRDMYLNRWGSNWKMVL